MTDVKMIPSATQQIATPRMRLSLILMAVVIVISAIAGFLGAPSWILLVAAGIPWFLYLGDRLGAATGGATVVLLSLWLLLVVQMATPLTAIPFLSVVLALWGVAGLLGVVICARTEIVSKSTGWGALALWGGSAVGGLVWIITVCVANVLPGAAGLAWVMQGDSANNVLFAREVIYRNGIGVGPAENPVPLPSAIMAVVMASGRDGVSAQDLLRHDLSYFAQAWTLCIVLTCVMAGVVAGAIVRRAGAKALIIAVVAAGASLLPLSWFFTGYPLEFGFFNTHVALPVVFAAFVAYLSSREHPAVVLALLAVASTLLLAVWSPLVLIPAMLGAIVVVTQWRSIVSARGLRLAALTIGLLQMIVYGLAVVLPSFLNLSGFLSAPGGAFGFRRWMVAGLALAAILLAAIAFRRIRDIAVVGVIALSAATAIGLMALLFASRAETNPWSYYPLKFAWLASAVFVVLIVSLAVAAVVRLASPVWVQFVGVAVVTVGTLIFLQWAPSAGVGYVWRDPIDRVLSGDVAGDGDEIAERIVELADPEQPHLLWHTEDPFEGSINFWIMQMWSDSMTQNMDLKRAAYGMYDPEDIQELCRLNSLMGSGVIVHTADAAVEEQASAACGDPEMRFVLVPAG